MAAKLEKTSTPGIFKGGNRYVVVIRVEGRQRKEFFRTYDEARRAKRAREADRDRGEFAEQSRLTFRAYAEEWVERHQGRGGRGFRETTRDEYRRDLEKYAYPYFGSRLNRRLSAVTPRDVANWLAWVADDRAHERKRPLSRDRVRGILAPVRSCFGTAVGEHLIRFNPCDGSVLPYTEPAEATDAAEQAKALTREQLAAFLAVVRPEWRLFFEFLAATGLRWSEIIALQWRHLDLDGATPVVKVRRRYRKGAYGPPKSKYGIRDVPLPWAIADALRARHGADEALVFPSTTDTPLDHSNTLRRILRPAAEEAGASWAGFHSFRHTTASLLFAQGRNVKQVQRWLGHHAASFTLDVYGHLLDEGVGEGLDVADELAGGNSGGNTGATEDTGTHRNADHEIRLESDISAGDRTTVHA